VSNTEFTPNAICTASRKYQALKLVQLNSMGLSDEELQRRVAGVVEKTCLCEDLAGSAQADEKNDEETPAVAVCPGPGLSYFSRIATLQEMVGHIYGRVQLLSNPDRPNMFIKELQLYVEYLRKEIAVRLESSTAREQHALHAFRANLLEGVAYYKSMIPRLAEETAQYREKMRQELNDLEDQLLGLLVHAAPLGGV
jgi:hypothetical protein